MWSRLRARLPKDKGEVKGKLLSESHYADIVAILKRNQVLFEVTGIDLSGHSETGLKAHQQRMADGLVVNLTDKHHPNIVGAMQGLRRELMDMRPPGYVQSLLTFNVLQRCLQHSTLYHCQRDARELGDFTWVVDAKDAGSIATPWEKWWVTVLLPYIQSVSMRDPGVHLEEGNYSYFEPYLLDELPKYLADIVGPIERPARPIDLRKVFGKMRFSSKAEAGLELVDVLTNGVRRAVRGNLRPEGWMPIREVMVHRSQQYIGLISLNGAAECDLDRRVLEAFTRGGRDVFTKSVRLRP